MSDTCIKLPVSKTSAENVRLYRLFTVFLRSKSQLVD